ncbi:PepSY-like domain-containing protein [uncultured Helicobacter sp.]|uniref:PepSY-like domain-containing protein n=1 Tax=uncultured Helicobacter sp. TaxID=175537 RepID=UPI00261A67B5|nr:PepSY-like domain-containing protein [uncultured Helicobacter sp.]
MKKLGLACAFSVLVGANALLAADVVIQQNELPQNSQKFIQTYFANEKVGLVEKSFNDYEVKFLNDSKVEFAKDGDWREVKSYAPISNTGFIPQGVLNGIKAKYATAKVMEISKSYNGYEVKLDNHKELIMDKEGKVLSEKY